MAEVETNPELLLAQHGWRRVKDNINEAANAKRVIEVNLGNDIIATFYTEQPNANLPAEITVLGDHTLPPAEMAA